MSSEPSESAEQSPTVRRRNRHGRGGRGPDMLAPPGIRNPRRSPARRFDDLVHSVVSEVDEPWREPLGTIEYAVEDLPLLEPDWTGPVPLALVVEPREGAPTRVVFFRRPLERRALSREDLAYLVRRVAAEKIGEVLGLAPEDVDPTYDPDDEV